MKIHTSLTGREIYRMLGDLNGVGFTRFNESGSRTHPRKFDVILYGNSPRRQNFGEDKAATYDEWGVFLARVFHADPKAKAGESYANAEHFHWATNGRYSECAMPKDAHKQHRWVYVDDSVIGAYSSGKCRDCSAYRRWAYKEYIAEHFEN